MDMGGSTNGGTEADDLRAVERARLRALVEADMETAGRLHAPDFQLINPSGRVISREEYLSDVASGEVNYLLWEPDSEIAVRLYGQLALVRYRSRIEIVVYGEKSALNCWHTDTYEKSKAQWQVVWSQATQIR